MTLSSDFSWRPRARAATARLLRLWAREALDTRRLKFETLSLVRVAGMELVVPRIIRDYRGHDVRLTDERLEHIVTQHPELARLGTLAIEEAIRHPDAVIVSPAAPDDRLHYRQYLDPDLGEKFLCVVVKSGDAFVVTAYVTARQKKGVRVWPETT